MRWISQANRLINFQVEWKFDSVVERKSSDVQSSWRMCTNRREVWIWKTTMKKLFKYFIREEAEGQKGTKMLKRTEIIQIKDLPSNFYSKAVDTPRFHREHSKRTAIHNTPSKTSLQIPNAILICDKNLFHTANYLKPTLLLIKIMWIYLSAFDFLYWGKFFL